MKSIAIKLVPLLVLAGLLINPGALAQQALEKTGYLPEFESSKENIEALEKNLAKTGELADILKRGNDELSEAVRQYRQDHKAETKDRVYGLLGDLAGTTARQIDDIVANKDQMRDGLTHILYKMQRIQNTLTDRQKGFVKQVKDAKDGADAIKAQLRELARKIKSDPQNAELRKEFRKALFKLRNSDYRYRTYQAHQRLTEKFAKQVDTAHLFFEQLNNNTDQLIANLEQQKEFLVMKVSLLKDAAEMESWLRGEGESTVSAFALMKGIGELSGALEKFNAATDVLAEFNDIDALMTSLPDAGEILGIEGVNGGKGENFEDKYIEYFLKN
jgi:uncharacterized phage infection (PIP) family protein YhgE